MINIIILYYIIMIRDRPIKRPVYLITQRFDDY